MKKRKLHIYRQPVTLFDCCQDIQQEFIGSEKFFLKIEEIAAALSLRHSLGNDTLLQLLKKVDVYTRGHEDELRAIRRQLVL